MYGFFRINNIRSQDYQLMIVNPNSDDEFPHFGGYNYIAQRPIDYEYERFITTEKQSIGFTLTFMFCDGLLNQDRLNIINRFLCRSRLVEFRLEDDPDRFIRIVSKGAINSKCFSGEQGTITIEFQAETPYWLIDKTYVHNTTELGDTLIINSLTMITDKNGNLVTYPKVKITSTGTRISIVNESHNYGVSISSTLPSDTIALNMRNISSQLGDNVFMNWNKNPFILFSGVNVLRLSGDFGLEVRAEYPVF